MKFLIFALIILCSCSLSKSRTPTQTISAFELYKVYKIDSIHNFYLIYAKKRDSIYKIVSQKYMDESCNRIRVNNEYQFNLHSSLTNRRIGSDVILPQNSLLVNCFYYDDSTTICIERDSINDLHYATNVRGLCIEK